MVLLIVTIIAMGFYGLGMLIFYVVDALGGRGWEFDHLAGALLFVVISAGGVYLARNMQHTRIRLDEEGISYEDLRGSRRIRYDDIDDIEIPKMSEAIHIHGGGEKISILPALQRAEVVVEELKKNLEAQGRHELIDDPSRWEKSHRSLVVSGHILDRGWLLGAFFLCTVFATIWFNIDFPAAESEQAFFQRLMIMLLGFLGPITVMLMAEGWLFLKTRARCLQHPMKSLTRDTRQERITLASSLVLVSLASWAIYVFAQSLF